MITTSELKEIFLLQALEESELENLAAIVRQHRFPKGSYILHVDDPGPSIMFLLEGTAKVTLVSRDGKEIVIANLGKGEFFGEVALLTGEDRSANVVATSDCELLVLGESDFHQHILENTGLALAMMRELALRLRIATSKIGDLALFDVYRRVARTLRSLAQSETIDEQTRFIISKRPTHQELASMVGTSREMVTRALKGLEEDGCIVVDGKQIEVVRVPI